ncbi:uncharacterized protein L969DRAFT_87168 [Mixia osmundae IAM 14324]|uniref:uncharacterized protein n=1 Tax=Mixia osmundae (strain CBS 9802 / IAM 14324 / JCM 22182 / KY 12970) TaxID=764103 RepID=UPI0004A55384|nr:uncharacterized protein L969DRAFT_87168 [Mixia osmundae IAM 14324]KEI39222.1 hypothetical protein L969DRAFT_87168 [Mixia osmundae IAM 14324]
MIIPAKNRAPPGRSLPALILVLLTKSAITTPFGVKRIAVSACGAQLRGGDGVVYRSLSKNDYQQTRSCLLCAWVSAMCLVQL